MAYEAEVNKNSINMTALTWKLNHRHAEGWELDKIFEQHGNTVMIWKKRGPAEKSGSTPAVLPASAFPRAGWYGGPQGPRYFDGTNWAAT